MKKYVLLQIYMAILFIFQYKYICIAEKLNSLKKLEEENGEDFDSKESMAIAEPQNQTVCTRRQGSSMHEIKTAHAGQFPFVVAIMSQKNDYLCSGTIVSDGLILTTTMCASRAAGYVLLNATTDRKDEHTHSYAVIDVEEFPTHDGPNPAKDVALLHTERFNSSHDDNRIKISNFTIPQDIMYVEAFGYGLNAEVGQPKDLQYIGLEVREPFSSLFLYAYFDCVDTKVLTCFKDSGGPAIVVDELIGVVYEGQKSCTKEISSQYMINKNMASIMPVFLFRSWLNEKIRKNEEQAIDTVTVKNSGRRRLDEISGFSDTPKGPDTDKVLNKEVLISKVHGKAASGGCEMAFDLVLLSLTLVSVF